MGHRMTVSTSVPLDDTTRRLAMQSPAATGPVTGRRAWMSWLSEPHILFSTLTILVLGVIWGLTLNLIKIERANAAHAATTAALELVTTYEAQVVRALREIDQTLKIVKYAYETEGARAALSDLDARTLLPPELLFVVSIVNTEGVVMASSRPAEAPSVSEPGFQQELRSDTFWIDRPRKAKLSGEWTLQFARALNAADGSLAGAVVVAVDASYFVSGYDPSVLGQKGLLGLLGTDGVFRVRRTGDTVTAGEATDYASAVPGADQRDPTVSLVDNGGDGIRRYTGAQQLYAFPLAVIAGLSEDEQLAATSVKPSATIDNWLWPSSTSIGSNKSTIPWGMKPATNCCRKSRTGSRAVCARATPWHAWGAMSSSCC
jgi:two-component system, NtrC family, sensor kinase